MSQCPFCAADVEEQIALYGGTCQSCFAFVPGEEAATDPGEDVKMVQEQQDQKRAKRRAFLPLAIAVPLVIGVAAVATWAALRPAPELAVLDLDAGEYYMPEFDQLVVASLDTPPNSDADPPGVGEVQAVAVKTERPAGGNTAALKKKEASKPKIGIKKVRLGGADDEADIAALAGDKADDLGGTRRSVGTADLGGDIDVKLTGSVLTSTGGSGPGLEMQVGSVSQAKPAISNPQLIARMVQSKMRRQLPKLRNCYEGALRARPDLKGSWVLKFTVTPEGKTKGVAAASTSMSDDGFEACMVRKMNGWRFDPITQAQPVKKTVDFTR